MEQPERYPYEVHEGGREDTFQWLCLKTRKDGVLEVGENTGFSVNCRVSEKVSVISANKWVLLQRALDVARMLWRHCITPL